MLMTIQRAAQESGVSPTTLRIYERLGLLSPSRDSANRRLYSPVDVAQARKIAAARIAGADCARESQPRERSHCEAPGPPAGGETDGPGALDCQVPGASGSTPESIGQRTR
jgi:MerR HTH family regulatory protein